MVLSLLSIAVVGSFQAFLLWYWILRKKSMFYRGDWYSESYQYEKSLPSGLTRTIVTFFLGGLLLLVVGENVVREDILGVVSQSAVFVGYWYVVRNLDTSSWADLMFGNSRSIFFLTEGWWPCLIPGLVSVKIRSRKQVEIPVEGRFEVAGGFEYDFTGAVSVAPNPHVRDPDTGFPLFSDVEGDYKKGVRMMSVRTVNVLAAFCTRDDMKHRDGAVKLALDCMLRMKVPPHVSGVWEIENGDGEPIVILKYQRKATEVKEALEGEIKMPSASEVEATFAQEVRAVSLAFQASTAATEAQQWKGTAANFSEAVEEIKGLYPGDDDGKKKAAAAQDLLVLLGKAQKQNYVIEGGLADLIRDKLGLGD